MTGPVLIALAAVALVLWLLLRGVARDRGLPNGEIVYSDTDAERLERALVSHRYQLTGKPDYIIRARDGTFPLEVKSRRCGTGPRDSELAQIWAYCLLVEEEAGTPVRFGLLQYADRKWPVPFGHRERRALLAILAEMRELEGAADVRRSHNHAGKCRGCDFNAPAICGQALA
jgi:CRISPR-associated exonuclease Cas4